MSVFIVAAGLGLSSAVTHFVLGLRRPRSGEHILFALMMLVLLPFQLVVARLHAAVSAHSIVELQRVGVVLAVALTTLFAAFVVQYTRTVVPPAIKWAYLVISAAWVGYDLISPFGLLASSPAVLGLMWQAFNALTVAWGTFLGWSLMRRGQRRRGLALVVGASLVLVSVVFDFVRDLLAKTTWPYLGGFGVVGLALVLTGQLAAEYRDNEQRLAQMLAAAIHLRDLLNTPLQTLRFGLEMMPEQTDAERARVNRLRRAVTTLTELGRDLQRERPG